MSRWKTNKLHHSQQMTPLTSEHTLGKCFLSRVSWTKWFLEDLFRSSIFRKVSGNAAKKSYFLVFDPIHDPARAFYNEIWRVLETCIARPPQEFFPTSNLTFHNSIGQYMLVYFHSQFCRSLLATFFRSTYIFRSSNHWKTTAFPLSFCLSRISQSRAGVISAAPPESPPCWFGHTNFCAFWVRGKNCPKPRAQKWWRSGWKIIANKIKS